jgi:hypothetical protein
MGYNSTLFILNDVMDEIDKDPAGWWAKAKASLMKAYFHEDYREREFGHGRAGNGFAAISNEHADMTVLIAVGGNHATVLHRVSNGGRHHTDEDQLALAKAWAERLGYRLVKRS